MLLTFNSKHKLQNSRSSLILKEEQMPFWIVFQIINVTSSIIEKLQKYIYLVCHKNENLKINKITSKLLGLSQLGALTLDQNYQTFGSLLMPLYTLIYS